MLDFNRMSKLQRILSAKSGTQIPKLQNAALPLQLNYDLTEAIKIFESGDRNGLRKYLLDRNIEIPNSIQSFIQGSDINTDEGHLELTNISKDVAKKVGSQAIIEKPKPSPEPAKPYTTNIQGQVISNTENPGIYINHNGEDVSKTVVTNTKEVDNTPSIFDDTQEQISFTNQNPEVEAKDELITEQQKDNGIIDQVKTEINNSESKNNTGVKSGLFGQILRSLSGINLKSVNPFSGKNWSKDGIFGKSINNTLNGVKDKFSDPEFQNQFGKIANVAGDLIASQDYEKSGTINTLNSALGVASSIPGIGMYAGAAKLGINAIDSLGGRADEFSVDTETEEQIGGSYGGSYDLINKAGEKAGKKFGLLSGGKSAANKQIAQARNQQSVLQGINKSAQDRRSVASSMSDINHLAYGFDLAGGYDQRYNRAAKHGMKFEPIIKHASEKENKQFIPVIEFKKGGKTPDFKDVISLDTTQKSVIPEGALHKNKHHLKDTGLDDSELTKKGIPVVDNDGEQQAEIELNEIIFTLEVTKELEKRYKEFYEEGTSSSRKDELALEAGKLLWKEILYNTDDRTGLIDTLKQGGTIDKKSIGGAFVKFTPVITNNRIIMPNSTPPTMNIPISVPINTQEITETPQEEQKQEQNKENTTPKESTNTILINKSNRTLTVGDKTFKISISKKGLDQTSKSGDNFTPEGEFSLGAKEKMGAFFDKELNLNRPNAYGGRFYRLLGGIANGRGFGIHGSDEYNDPDKYEIGRFGTHGCVAMKNSDLEQLEKIFDQNGGSQNFKVKIIKAENGGILSKNSGIITQHDIDQMVKQALLNILTK